MKTPDEIKKWLEYCHSSKPCIDCKYDQRDFPHCVRSLLADAINGYEKLVSRLAQVERERDAAVADILHVLHTKGTIDAECLICDMEKPDCHWECEKGKWRGVCEDNTKDDADA